MKIMGRMPLVSDYGPVRTDDILVVIVYENTIDLTVDNSYKDTLSIKPEHLDQLIELLQKAKQVIEERENG